jgi:prevent-host-death family protein
MARVVTSEDLRARLGRELDTLKDDVVYVSKRGRLAGVLVDIDRYSELIERLDFLEDSLAALQAREDAALSVPWSEVRG